MHETARGLHSAGLISMRRMSEFEALCNLDVEAMAPKQIKLLRENAHISQAVFAAVLNAYFGKSSGKAMMTSGSASTLTLSPAVAVKLAR